MIVAARDGGLDGRVEVEQAQRVGDRRARPPDPVGDCSWREPELVDELAVGEGGLDRVEVLALEVLDERELELLAVGELADDRRDPVQAGRDRGPEATLAGDELVAVEGLGHEDRLDDAVLGDARRERARAPPRRCAGAAGTGSGGSRSVGISVGAGWPAWRCGMSDASPRPRLWRALRADGHATTSGSRRPIGLGSARRRRPAGP